MEPFYHTKDQYDHAGHFIDVGLQSQDIIIRHFATSPFQTVHFVKKKKKKKKKMTQFTKKLIGMKCKFIENSRYVHIYDQGSPVERVKHI